MTANLRENFRPEIKEPYGGVVLEACQFEANHVLGLKTFQFAIVVASRGQIRAHVHSAQPSSHGPLPGNVWFIENPENKEPLLWRANYDTSD